MHVLGVLSTPELLEIQVQFQRKTKMQQGKKTLKFALYLCNLSAQSCSYEPLLSLTICTRTEQEESIK